MPATRSNSRVKPNATALPLRTRPSKSDDEVIIISSDEEDVSSTGYALKRAQQEIRTLKKKLLAKEASSSQVLSAQRNNPPDSMSSSARNKIDEERLRLEGRLQQASADIQRLNNLLRVEKEGRSGDVVRLKKHAKAAEKELESLRTKNKELAAEVRFLNEDIKMRVQGGHQKNDLSDLENHILCEVCTETLWQPYILSACGHTFCQGCLIGWFNTAVSMNAHDPQYTCPTCRARVHQKPVEDYALKGVVRAISHMMNPAGGLPPAPPRKRGHGPWYRFFG